MSDEHQSHREAESFADSPGSRGSGSYTLPGSETTTSRAAKALAELARLGWLGAVPPTSNGRKGVANEPPGTPPRPRSTRPKLPRSCLQFA